MSMKNFSDTIGNRTCDSVAVVRRIVGTKQIRINIYKRNNTKNTVQTIQNTVNASTHITKTPTQLSKHTHITKSIHVHTFEYFSHYYMMFC